MKPQIRSILATLLAASLLLSSVAAAATNTIAPGQRIVATIESATAFDVYEFAADSGDTVSILMAYVGGGFNTAFSLYAPDGALVIHVPGGYSADLPRQVLGQSGTYQIHCRDAGWAGAGTYALSLLKHPGTNVNDTPFAPGQYHQGSLLAGERHSFRFSGVAGERVSALMAWRGGPWGVRLDVYAPDGGLLTSAPGGYTAEVTNLLLSVTGEYQIVCRDADGWRSGAYALSLISHARTNVNDVPFAPGQYHQGSLQAGERHSFRFSGVAGERVSALMAWRYGPWDVRLDVHAPDGGLLVSAPGGYTTEVTNLLLPVTGEYQIVCRDAEGSHPGGYALSLVSHSGTNLNFVSIEPGQTHRDTLPTGGMNALSFFAQTGDAVSILMANIAGSINVRFDLYSPAGILLTNVIGSYSADLRAFRLASSGTHQVVCRNAGGLGEGVYGLSLVKNPGPNQTDPDGGLIQSGERRFGVLDSGDQDVFTFAATPGGSISLNLAWLAGAYSPQLELHGPDGHILRTASGPTCAGVTNLCLWQAGAYLIVCRSAEGYGEGSYALAMRYSPPSLPPSSGSDPVLVLSVCETSLAVHWPAAATGFVLESTETLLPANWTPVEQTPQAFGDRLVVPLRPTGSMRFYRLHCPGCAASSAPAR